MLSPIPCGLAFTYSSPRASHCSCTGSWEIGDRWSRDGGNCSFSGVSEGTASSPGRWLVENPMFRFISVPPLAPGLGHSAPRCPPCVLLLSGWFHLCSAWGPGYASQTHPIGSFEQSDSATRFSSPAVPPGSAASCSPWWQA